MKAHYTKVKKSPEGPQQGHGHRLQQAYLGPIAKQKSIRIPSRMQFGENNIMEDELPCLLISAPDNCLPRCWPWSEENDDRNKDEDSVNPIWNNGDPVQCCRGSMWTAPLIHLFKILKV